MSAVYCSRTASCWVVMQLDGSIRCIIRFKAKMHQCNQVNIRIAARSTKEQHITALLREASREWHIKKMFSSQFKASSEHLASIM